MSEWFYIQRWKSNNKLIWTIIDDDFNLCIPDDKFVTRYHANDLARKLQEENLIKYRVIHNKSEDYFYAIKNKEGKNENKRNEQSRREHRKAN